MYVITGATGKLGAAVVDHLLARVPADRVAVSVRDPEQAGALADRGVRVRRGAFDDAASLASAFEGATQVLLVSVSDTGDTALRRHRTAVAAAREAGAGRILYTSHMGAGPSSPFAPMPDHAATEAVLRDGGVPFTSLRNGFYTATVLLLLGEALRTGVLAAPQDGPVSWTAHADLAEAAAIVLTEGGFEGVTPALTAGEALDLADVARIAGELTGRSITRTVVPDARYRDTLVSHGVPQGAAEMLVGMFEASRQGDFAAVDPALRRLLGRPPATVREVLARAL